MVVARGTDSAKIVRVIQTRALKGAGTMEDPIRWITQYWDFKGKLLAEKDDMEEIKKQELKEKEQQNSW